MYRSLTAFLSAVTLCFLFGYGIGDGGTLPKRLLYVSQCCNVSQVFVYDRDGKGQRPIERITSGIAYALGLAVDRHGNLYVADDNDVLVYKPGAITPFRSVGPNAGAYYVAVASDGTVYAGQICSACTGKIAVFPPQGGSYEIQEPTVLQVRGLAVDAHDNLYADYTVDYVAHTQIFMYPPKSVGYGKNLGITEDGGGGIAFDARGNLVIATGLPSVDVFAPGATQPMLRFGRFFSPQDLAFNPEKTRLYVLQAGYQFVTTFEYPSGRVVSNTRQYFANRLTGVAAGPSSPR